ncbi:S-layer homology domain-containing protein [Marinicrinis sediminis]|uniref:S-layer homology domain-containing protein n=1 Tax=Marinicrinis sediminis TaxID=1652465 RepID=A0ABW5RDS5_9BACL
MSKRWMKLGLSLILFLAAALPVWGAEVDQEKEGSVFDPVLGSTWDERRSLYELLRLDVSSYEIGQVISSKPYVVVSAKDEKSKDAFVKLRIWNGMLSRSEQGLDVAWDELWLNAQGKVTLSVIEDWVYMENYFSAKSQSYYRTEDYIGKIPFIADIPTDQEAAAKGEMNITEDGSYNLYNMQFEDFSLYENTEEAVKLAEEAPVIMPVEVPGDALTHWSRDFIAQLMKAGIIAGFPDGTIKPKKQLTKGEFVALLVRALELPTDDPALETGYPDAKGTWVAVELAAAEQVRLVSKGNGHSFEPAKGITRIEMAVMLYRAAELEKQYGQADAKVFRDTDDLTVYQRQALDVVTRLGWINGYEDKTFKPHHTLTRAEAFTVISIMYEQINE